MYLKQALPAIIISLALVLSVTILTRAYEHRYRANDSIQVTGLGSRDFKSDLIVWRASFTRRSFSMKEAYAQLRIDRELITRFLNEKQVGPEEHFFSSISIIQDYRQEYDASGNIRSVFNGYVLTQTLTIESKRVDEVEAITRDITELIENGLEIYSYSPEYYYTQLADLKIELIADATKDARQRAEKVAQEAGARLGDLQDAQVGVFQITAQNSNEDYSWGGAFNTSAKMKTANITVRLRFGIR